MNTEKIVVVGSFNIDMVVRADKLPAPGETILGNDFFMNSGGKGANQVVAVSRLGKEKPVFIAKIGNDLLGKNAMEVLRAENINTGYVFIDPEIPTGVALITVDKQGENSIVVASGANARLCIEDIDKAKAKDIIEKSDIVLLQLETPIETVEYVAKLAYRSGSKVILNPAPMRNIPDSLLKYLYAIVPNRIEAEMLSGITIVDSNSACAAADAISRKGVKNVIITMGESGAFVKCDGIFLHISAERREAIDTTAAGDTFCGAFCVGISEGLSVTDAVKMANTAAGISVTRKGAQSSIPYRKEVRI